MVRALCVLLLSTFIFNLSEQANILSTPLPKPEESFTLTYIQNEASCTYVVAINTSCSSSIFTRNNISIAFGDDSGNQIYVPRLEGPSASTFKPCSSDIFEVKGPCAKQICYEYLYETGPDKWIPETVKIYGYNTRAVTFYYNTSIPEELWFGYSLCHPPTSTPPPSPPPPHIFPPPPPSPPPPHIFPPFIPSPPPPPPPHYRPPPPPHSPPPPPPHYQPPPPPPHSPPPPPPHHQPPPPPPPHSPPPPPPHHQPPPPPSPPPPQHNPPPPPPPSSSNRGYASAGWFSLSITGLVYALFQL